MGIAMRFEDGSFKAVETAADFLPVSKARGTPGSLFGERGFG